AVADPRPWLAVIDQERYQKLLGRDVGRRLPEVGATELHLEGQAGPTPGAAASSTVTSQGAISGRVQRFGDHVDTDAIIPGQFCHLTDQKELGDHCFEFVRPGFAARARAGQNIVVAGEGWGSGSSREQAVWALQGAGIAAVVARSFAFIHKRNLVNEALPYLAVSDTAFYELAAEDAELAIDLDRGE